MGIRNSDELKEWMEKLTIINDSKSLFNKQPQTMKNFLLNRHHQLLKDVKSLNKIREKLIENQIIFAEQEDETTYRFDITPIFMAASPLLLIAFEDITQYQKSSKKKNEQLNICSMIFDNLKYISCKLEHSLHTILNQKIHPKLNEIQKISSYFINQLLIFVDIPKDIPLQKFKFKDIFSPIQTLFSSYQYMIEVNQSFNLKDTIQYFNLIQFNFNQENVGEINVSSNVLLLKYCIISLFSCFENSKQQIKIILKNIHSKYIMIEVVLHGNYQVDLFKKMNQSSNDFASRKQINLFQRLVQKISPEEIKISFHSELNITQVFLSLYINLEEKSLEKSQNWINFINKTQQVLISASNKNEGYHGEILNGVNSINHSYISTLSQFFLNDKTTQFTQNTPKIRKISLQNNIRKFSKEYTRKRNSSLSMQSPKNEILEQYTRMYPTIQENNLSEIKSIASGSNLNEEGSRQYSNMTIPISQPSVKNINKLQSDPQNPKSIFSNRQILSDIENGLIIQSPKTSSPDQDFIDLLKNNGKTYQSYKEDNNYKNSYLSLSCKSQFENQLENKNIYDFEVQQNRFKEFTLSQQQQQQSKQFEEQELYDDKSMNKPYTPPHFKQEPNEQQMYIQNNSENFQLRNNDDKQYASTSSITYISQKQNDESLRLYNQNNISLSNSICQMDNSLNYQFQTNNINFQDRNKFQQQSPSKQFSFPFIQQQIKIM